MNELLAALPGGAATAGGGFVLAIVALAAYIPKLLNAMKTDRQESAALKRIDDLEQRSIDQSEMIHKLKINFTKAISALISVRSWHIAEGHQIPTHIANDFKELLEEKQDV